MSDFRTVDEYIAAQPEPARGSLERVREIIRKAMPRADEVISYKMPTYKLKGEPVLYLAGWKNHYSLYPAGECLVEKFRDELASCKISKGTIRFRLSEPVPAQLIERIAKFRAKEAADHGRAKAGR